MATLDADFERKAREAFLDDIEAGLPDLADRFVEAAHDRLRDYGSRYGYSVDPIIDSLEVGSVERGQAGVSIRLEWTHEAAGYFEVGTSEHQVTGNPTLSFVWDSDDAPAWVAEEFEPEGDGYRVFFPEVTVDGLPESRYIRETFEWLRGELRQ